MNPNPKNHRTYILEDQFFDLTAIKSILGKIPGIQIVGSSDSLSEAIRECGEKKPDLIIADAEIHGNKRAGAIFVQTIRPQLPEVHILGMTRYPDYMEDLRRAGCDYVVNKNLIESPDVCAKYIEDCFIIKPEYFVEIEHPPLTPEEEFVLKGIRDGSTEDAIAAEMGYDDRKPVRKVKDSLFKKLNAVNVANLIDLAYKLGYLKPDDQ